MTSPNLDSRLRFLDSELAQVQPKTRAGLMVAAARKLVGQPYLHGGRTPAALDGFGLIRVCVQAALDHQTGAWAPVAEIEDTVGLGIGNKERPQVQDNEVPANRLGQILEIWGMHAVSYGHGARYTLPGDVKVSVGAGPAGAIVSTGFQPGQTEWVIMAWQPSGPEVRGDCMLGRNCARTYRWPEEAVR